MRTGQPDIETLHRPIKLMIWLYFALLIAEGALRKWIFPGFSDLLFVVRDPVVLLIYLFAMRAGAFSFRPAMVILLLLAMISLVFAIANDMPVLITLFGLRTDFLHLPLIFVMGAVLNRDDVLRYGRWFLLTSVPIMLLMVMQFNASPDAMVNFGVGGMEGGQLRGAMGKIRPPGPFSFVTGVVVYFQIVAAFVCLGWMRARTFSLPLLAAATIATVAACPVSISRSFAVSILVVAFFGLLAAMRDPRWFSRLFGLIAVALVVLMFAANTIYVRAYVSRWNEGLTFRGGNFASNVLGRVYELFAEPFRVVMDTPLLGHGIGVGTVAGARLMTGSYAFLLSESELARTVLELGPLLGFAFIGWRFWLVATMAWRSWQVAMRTGDALPWLLVGGTFFNILSGLWGQATLLGFAVFGAGLTFAAMNEGKNDVAQVR